MDQVTDVVSVNQVVKVMCIDVDLRGNIRVSLKATTPSQGSKTKAAARAPIAFAEQTPQVWETVDDFHKEGTQAIPPRESGEILSSILIRSTAEQTPKARETVKDLHKKGTRAIPPLEGGESLSSFLIQSTAEWCKEEKSAGVNQNFKGIDDSIK